MQVFNDFVILAKDVSVDSKDNMLSIFKIVDKFNFALDSENYNKFVEESKEKAVGMPAQYVMSSSWSLDKITKKNIDAVLVSKLIDPSGKELASSQNDIVFTAGSDRVRLNGAVEGIPVTQNGRYKVEVNVLDKATSKVMCTGSTTYQVSVDENVDNSMVK